METYKNLARLKPGDVLVRENGERCKLMSIETIKHMLGRDEIIYVFRGFRVYSTVMRLFFRTMLVNSQEFYLLEGWYRREI